MLSNLLIRGYAEIKKLVKNENADPVVRFVQEKKQDFWEEMSKTSFQNRVVCCLRYFEPGKIEPSWNTLINDHKRFAFIKGKLDERFDKLYQGYITFAGSFERFGFRELDRIKTFLILYRLVNQGNPPEYRPDLSLNAQLCHSNIHFSNGHGILNNNNFVSVIGMKYPPAGSVALYLRRFYELDFPLILKQTFGFAEKAKLWKTMDFNKNIANSLSGIDKTCALYVDEVKDFQNRVESEKELPVHWNFIVSVFAHSEEELKIRNMKVQNLLKEIGSFGLVEKNNFRNGFFSVLPGHERFYLRKSLITTSNVGDLLSAYTLYGGDADPIEYFQDRQNGVFSYNPFTAREKAHHMCITGPTGSGKSFFVNKLLLSSLINNPIIYVIDLKKSFVEFFEFLAEEMPDDTAIMRISQARTDFKFNPFLIQDLSEPVPDRQINFCLGLLKLMMGSKIDHSEEWDLLEGLKMFFEKYRVLLRNQREGKPIPPLNLLANTIDRKVSRKDLANAVRIWAVGRKGEIFNSGEDTLKMARHCYFDISDLENEPDLMAVLVYCIFSKIYEDATDSRKQKIQKYLFCDEAHLYLHQSEEMAFWIEHLFRTGRHHNLLVGVVTQSIKDLLNNEAPWSKGIVENIRQAFFFNGQKGIKDAFKTFQMTDFHVEQYYKMKPERYELLYWSAGGLRRILRPVTDPHTYWMAATQAVERALRSDIKALCGGDVRQTIETCVRETFHTKTNKERIQTLDEYIQRKSSEIGKVRRFVKKEA